MICPSKKNIKIRINLISRLIQDLIQRPLDRNYQILKPLIFSPNDFKRDFLNPEEMERINTFKALKKQVEWLCGRFSAKTLAQEFLMPDHGLAQVKIDYLEQGAPYLTAFEDHCLSLSHSGIYTAAALVMEPNILMGIDIEAVGPRPGHAFMKTAFTARQIKNMGNCAHDVFVSWTLKEAYLKYIRKGFNESLHRVEIIKGRIYHHGQEKHLACRSLDLDNGYILSMVFPQDATIQLS